MSLNSRERWATGRVEKTNEAEENNGGIDSLRLSLSVEKKKKQRELSRHPSWVAVNLPLLSPCSVLSPRSPGTPATELAGQRLLLTFPVLDFKSSAHFRNTQYNIQEPQLAPARKQQASSDRGIEASLLSSDARGAGNDD